MPSYCTSPALGQVVALGAVAQLSTTWPVNDHPLVQSVGSVSILIGTKPVILGEPLSG